MRVGPIDAIAQRNIRHGGEAFGQRHYGRTWIKMRLKRKIERLIESAGQIRLQRGQRSCADALALAGSDAGNA